jgi:signal transduction histidine kinase
MGKTLIRERQNVEQKSGPDVSMFLAMVSHELLTPTTAILGWASLLRDGPADEGTVAHGVEVIERNARLQSRLIEQLLDYSRASNGLLGLDARRGSLVPVLEAAVDTMLPQAKAKEVELRVSYDASTGAVICDSLRLQQVVTNLIANAVKFTSSRGRVDIQLARRGAYAEVTVADTGRGIRPEFLPYIFEPFRQAGGEGWAARDGLGLGLTIARHIVEGHKGEIRADSPGEGRGAKFTITLPLDGNTAGRETPSSN